jgi:hypothetical protein
MVTSYRHHPFPTGKGEQKRRILLVREVTNLENGSSDREMTPADAFRKLI